MGNQKPQIEGQTMQENKKKDKVRNIIEHYKYMHTNIFDEVLFIVHIYDLVFDPLQTKIKEELPLVD